VDRGGEMREKKERGGGGGGGGGERNASTDVMHSLFTQGHKVLKPLTVFQTWLNWK